MRVTMAVAELPTCYGLILPAAAGHVVQSLDRAVCRRRVACHAARGTSVDLRCPVHRVAVLHVPAVGIHVTRERRRCPRGHEQPSHREVGSRKASGSERTAWGHECRQQQTLDRDAPSHAAKRGADRSPRGRFYVSQLMYANPPSPSESWRQWETVHHKIERVLRA
jgi:hypothetical protein